LDSERRPGYHADVSGPRNAPGFQQRQGDGLGGRLVETVLPIIVIVIVGVIAYHNCFDCPFIFDDDEVIAENPNIRSLWPLRHAMSAPPQSAAAGRPVLSLSLAISYRFSGLDPWGYHAFNLGVHILAALTLFGVVRRTLSSRRLRTRFGPASVPLATVIALIWAVHPLQTESVTYIVQRAESMMGLFYLLTLYCAVRGFDSARPAAWAFTAFVACSLGMATKEVMVTAPILVIVYDRLFIANSFRQALERRGLLYGLLAAGWIVLAALVATGPRSETAGFGIEQVTALEYAGSQFAVILHYLRLAVWPDPLCLAYGWLPPETFWQVVPPMFAILAIGVASIIALKRSSPWGYLGAWFFLILAPSSSIIPIADLAFEHRMYLPLAAVCAFVVAVVYLALDWLRRQARLPARAATVLGILLAVGVVSAMTVGTIQRNGDYRTAVSIWQDVVNKRPENRRGHNNLAGALCLQGDVERAVSHYREALRLDPEYTFAHHNLGLALLELGASDGAISSFHAAISLDPDWAEPWYGCAVALITVGRFAEAEESYANATRLQPENPAAHCNLGKACHASGLIDQAIAYYRKAIDMDPDSAEAHNNLGVVLMEQGRADAAIDHHQAAARLRPHWAEAHYNHGICLAALGRHGKATVAYLNAIDNHPDYPEAHYNLGNTLLRLRRPDQAIRHYEQALLCRPDYLEAHYNLAGFLLSQGRTAAAKSHLAEALQIAFRLGDGHRAEGRLGLAVEAHRKAAQIAADNAEAHYRLGRDLADLDRSEEAIQVLRQALEREPRHAAALQLLASLEHARE